MKITRKRYQQGSIRKAARAKGFVWEYRYSVVEQGKRKQKTQTFRGNQYATEADVRRAVGAIVPHLNDGTPYTPPVAVTFGTLLDRYIAEELPSRSRHAIRIPPSSRIIFAPAGRRWFYRTSRRG